VLKQILNNAVLCNAVLCNAVLCKHCPCLALFARARVSTCGSAKLSLFLATLFYARCIMVSVASNASNGSAPRYMLTKAWKPLDYHPVQSALWYSNKRFVCVPSGRGSGKTELAKRRLVRFLIVDRDKIPEHLGGRPVKAYGTPHMYAYLSPTRPQAKRIAWEHLKKLVPKQWLAKAPDETALIIRTIYNSELHVIGMDAPQRFEGDQWDGVVKDESSDHKPNVHLSILPAITFKNGWLWNIGVPKRSGTSAAYYRKQCELGMAAMSGNQIAADSIIEMLGLDPKEIGNDGANLFDINQYGTYCWPSWDILPKAAVAQLRATLDPKDFNEQVGGQWQSIGGAAFHQFNKDIHVRTCIHDPNKVMLVASDFNVRPMAWTLNHFDETCVGGYGLETFAEIWLNDTNTQSTLDTLWGRYGDKHKGGYAFFGDAASRQRKTSASSSDYSQILNDLRFKNAGARVIYPESNPPVKDRLASCNALLHNAAGNIRWHIDPKCVHLINDLETRGLNADGTPIDPRNKKNLTEIGHISDAAGYLIHMKWPSVVLDQYAEDKEQTATIGVYYGEDEQRDY
jgi:hypothetical protein